MNRNGFEEEHGGTCGKKAAVFALSRLRMSVDGPGITTLVTFMGCPLGCRYCANDICHGSVFEADGVTLRRGMRILTPRQLYDRVKIDNIYFQATGGGVCFGGGEPGLRADFIGEFRHICPPRWKITLETSLCYDCGTIRDLSRVTDYWIVDVKDMNPAIYYKYTGAESLNLRNLKFLRTLVSPERVTVRVPLIPDFNTAADVETSMEIIRRECGFNNFDTLTYIRKT